MEAQFWKSPNNTSNEDMTNMSMKFDDHQANSALVIGWTSQLTFAS